jgi:hypothetical protein
LVAAGFMNKEREEFIKLAKGVRIAGIVIALVGVFRLPALNKLTQAKLGYKVYLVKFLTIFYTVA